MNAEALYHTSDIVQGWTCEVGWNSSYLVKETCQNSVDMWEILWNDWDKSRRHQFGAVLLDYTFSGKTLQSVFISRKSIWHDVQSGSALQLKYNISFYCLVEKGNEYCRYNIARPVVWYSQLLGKDCENMRWDMLVDPHFPSTPNFQSRIHMDTWINTITKSFVTV